MLREPDAELESIEERKARVDKLWQAYEEVKADPNLMTLFDRRQQIQPEQDVRGYLKERGYPERTAINRLSFESWKPNLDPRFVKDGFFYALRGDFPGQDNKGFYSRTFGYGKKSAEQLSHELQQASEVGYLLYNDERYLDIDPYSESIAEELAIEQSMRGGSSFISTTTNLRAAEAGTGNSPDPTEQETYQVYVVKVPVANIINRNGYEQAGLDEQEYLVPDCVYPDEVAATFQRGDRAGVIGYFQTELGLSEQDLLGDS